jgi:hypothetical protein
VLVLREWDPSKKEYTRQGHRKEVTYVLKTKGQKVFPTEDVEKYTAGRFRV